MRGGRHAVKVILARFFGLAAAMVLATACSGAAPGAATPTSPGPNFFELGDDFSVGDIQVRGEDASQVTPVTLSLDEARAALPFEFGVPASAPEGFTLQDDVEVLQVEAGAYSSVILGWLNADEAAIFLQVAWADTSGSPLGGAGDAQPVTVNGQPATLVHVTRLSQDRLTLNWKVGDLAYTLTADGGAANGDDLVRMAESVP